VTTPPPARAHPRGGADRAATILLTAHVALIAFATLAMVTILAGKFPVWMQGPYTPRVYDLSWKYTGQIYVVLGLLAAIAHASPRIGTRRALALFAAAAGAALASELIGTNFGVPFGPYHYTAMLGPRVNGDVPYPIPLSWAYMLYASLAMCAVIGPKGRRAEGPKGTTLWPFGPLTLWPLLAGLLMTAWDVALEVHMTNVSPAHWTWDLAHSPALFPAFLSSPVFYGMPLSNWVGWFVTATLIARLMLAIVPPDVWRTRVAPSRLPLVLYAANGLMPIATTARHGLWGAAIGGAVLMGAPLAFVAAARHKGTRATSS